MWSFREASMAQRRYEATQASPSSFGYGWNLGDRSVLDGVDVTFGEKLGRATRQFVDGAANTLYTMVGGRSADQARANFSQGNYLTSAAYGVVGLTEAGSTLLTFGTGGATRATTMTAQELAATRASYLGDVYSPHFVGPVNWQYFYRGDATQRATFLSPMAEGQGVKATTSYLGLLDDAAYAQMQVRHSIYSDGSPVLSISSDEVVASHFARGPAGTQQGWVSVFRTQPSDASSFAKYNWESEFNTRINSSIGRREQEFLVPGRVDPKYFFDQYQVKP